MAVGKTQSKSAPSVDRKAMREIGMAMSNGGETMLRVLHDIAMGVSVVKVGDSEFVPTHAQKHAAAAEFLDRVFGKPTAPSEVTVAGDPSSPLGIEVRTDARERLAEKFARILAAGAPGAGAGGDDGSRGG